MHPGSRSPIAWAVGAGADYAARRAEVATYEQALRLLPQNDPTAEKFLEDWAEAVVYLEMEGAEYRQAYDALHPRLRPVLTAAFGTPPPNAERVAASGVAMLRLYSTETDFDAPAVAEAVVEGDGPDAAELAREADRDYLRERGVR
jgi:hypothetical protein